MDCYDSCREKPNITHFLLKSSMLLVVVGEWRMEERENNWGRWWGKNPVLMDYDKIVFFI
jgi:hypothetical protein